MKYCKQCKRNLDSLDFIVNNKDHKLCNKCRKYASAYNKKDRKENPEKYKKILKKYRENNLNRIRERDNYFHKKYREEYPEKYKEKREKYYNDNIEKMKSRDKHRMLERPEYFLFSGARGRAKNRNLEFNITEQNIKKLLNETKICPFRKTNFERGSNQKAVDNSMSLDRIDSSKGYIKNNIQIISYRANIIKNDITLELFKKIVSNFKKFKLEEHAIDDNTRSIIINNRLQQIKENFRENKDFNRLNHIESRLLGSAKRRIKKSKLELNINLNYIRSIWPLDNRCPILEEKFVFGKNVVNDFSATIDRIDNSKGYIKGNIRIIANKANVVKNKASLEELEFMLKNWEEMENNKCH